MQGGQVAVNNGKVRAELALPIAGLVSDRPLKEVIERIAGLNGAERAMGCRLEAPFMTLSFLSLSPIPELKLTDQGLIDTVHMRPTGLFVTSANYGDQVKMTATIAETSTRRNRPAQEAHLLPPSRPAAHAGQQVEPFSLFISFKPKHLGKLHRRC
jgi:hypothetical protein